MTGLLTRFELVMNLETINALGLIVPAPLLSRADEVSECHSKRRDCDPLPQTIRRLEVLSEASDKKHCSVVVAHSHLADFSSQVRADGRRISAVVAGCYSRQVESMSRQATVIAEMILIFNPPRNYRTSSGSTRYSG